MRQEGWLELIQRDAGAAAHLAQLAALCRLRYNPRQSLSSLSREREVTASWNQAGKKADVTWDLTKRAMLQRCMQSCHLPQVALGLAERSSPWHYCTSSE